MEHQFDPVGLYRAGLDCRGIGSAWHCTPGSADDTLHSSRGIPVREGLAPCARLAGRACAIRPPYKELGNSGRDIHEGQATCGPDDGNGVCRVCGFGSGLVDSADPVSLYGASRRVYTDATGPGTLNADETRIASSLPTTAVG